MCIRDRSLPAVTVIDAGGNPLITKRPWPSVVVSCAPTLSLSMYSFWPSPVSSSPAATVAGLLLTGDGQKLYIDSESVGAQETTTDGQGRFVMSGFPPASITVTAGKD